MVQQGKSVTHIVGESENAQEGTQCVGREKTRKIDECDIEGNSVQYVGESEKTIVILLRGTIVNRTK